MGSVPGVLHAYYAITFSVDGNRENVRCLTRWAESTENVRTSDSACNARQMLSSVQKFRENGYYSRHSSLAKISTYLLSVNCGTSERKERGNVFGLPKRFCGSVKAPFPSFGQWGMGCRGLLGLAEYFKLLIFISLPTAQRKPSRTARQTA